MISRRMQHINPFYVMKILARARELERQGREVIHLEIGEPDFNSPQPVIDAGIRALQEGKTHYSPARGIAELRHTLADYYLQKFQCQVDAENIVITPGASGALLLALGAIIDVGQEILIADPAYPCYRHFAYFLSAEAKSIAVGAAEKFQLSFALVERHWGENTKAVIIASPSNPTGTLIETDELQAIAQFVTGKGGVIIVDEIYQELVYQNRPQTALKYCDNVIVINSFSKYFGMTGWRLGWLVANDELMPMIDKLIQNLFLAAPTPAQYAALAAFTAEARQILEERRQEFDRRRSYLLHELKTLGFEIPVEPQGAFYIYAACDKLTDDSAAFAHDLLEQVGVAITPGRDFGEHDNKKYLRFAYTTGQDQLVRAVELMSTFLSKGGT